MLEKDQLHVRQAHEAQNKILREMSPRRRLEVAQELYETAWQLKLAGLRREHPERSDELIFAQARRVFLTGYAGA